jgi:GT2 family glycosyltransferase
VSVSIVIPVHNGCELLRGLLKSIHCQTVEPLEVIAVDNGSTDNAPEIAAKMGARVIAMERNAGFAAAVNRGIQAARGEGIALINSDVELDPRWLEFLWAKARDNSFATGRILQAASPKLLDGAFDLISRGACSWRAGAGRPDGALPDARAIRFCSATAVIYHASVFQKIGLFNETFDSYLEDMDFGLRCAAAGLTGWYLPEACCLHYGSATFGRWSPRVVRLISRNQVFLVARHYPGELIRRWWWPIVLGQLLWGGLAIRHGCGLAYLRGKLEGLRRFGQLRGTTAGLEKVISDSEQEIYQIQSREGFDAYWKVYFRLT